MKVPPIIRSLIPLSAGLAAGAIGATLFLQSLSGSEGSPEERAAKLEAELKHANNRIAALEGQGQERTAGGILGRMAGTDSRRRMADGTRKIAGDIRAGRPVTPEDIFRATQPLLRDLAPLFDRMRLKQQQQVIDSMTGELARKYNLTPQNQALLKQFFQKNAEEQAKQWSTLISNDKTRLQDLMSASRNVHPDAGLDTFMQGILPPDKLAGFNSERLAQSAERIQQEADRKVQQLDSITTLDEAQRDQVFAIMARSSPEYDPKMAVQGALGPVGGTPTGERQTALMAVLRPDQRAAYDAENVRRRDAAAKDMETIGLSLPSDWQMFDADN